MSNIKDVLKKLNKDRADEDKIKISTDVPDNFFKREVINTGSPYLNYKINKATGKGGIVRGSYNMFIGQEGSAKTSIALIATAKCQQELGKYVVYFDGESSVNDSYLDRFKVDRSLFICYKGRNLEEMLDTAQQMSLADDVGMIVIDSIPIFVSTVVEEKTTEEYNMAVEARKYTARMPIIEGNCARRDIALLGLTFYTLNPGVIAGDPRVIKRGAWQNLMSNLSLEFTKKALIFDTNKKLIGHIISVKMKKSKLGSYDKTAAFELNFYYEYGFNEIDEYVSIFIEEGIIKQGGAWFTLPNNEKLNGKKKVVTFFKDNPEYFEELKSELI